MSEPLTYPLKQCHMLATMAAALAVSAMAQQAKPIEQWANLSRVENGSEIRVVVAGGKTLRGFLQSVSPDSLAINATTSREALSRQEIKLVSEKRPGHRGRNTLIGLAIGAAGGLATGAVIDHGDHGWFPNLAKAVFTPIGALVGAVVGVAIPTGGWQVVYRAP
jgi:hypothetical protein